jgi:hypothetical protein
MSQTNLAARLRAYEMADQVMRGDLQHYCATAVIIQTKTGELQPFIWNEAQQRLHAKLEKQLDARGLVRAIILKARRLGISTYVGARFYHRSTLWLGRNAFILTHEDKSTQELFDLVKRVHEHMPHDYRPGADAANANELAFSGLDGGYRVGTAKNTAGTGRGLTLQLFHGSEVAFWPHAHKHFAGVIKAVSLVPGTEIILESTANGVGGTFYEQWVMAEKGLSDFIPIFLPWYIDPQNTRELPTDYEPSVEEEEYQRLYKLTDEQLCWAHFENINIGGVPGQLCSLFKQENPATAAEAFQTTGENSYIPAEAILRARHAEIEPRTVRDLPRVLGVDVARGGNDRTRLVDRQGRIAGRIDIAMHTDDLMQIAHQVMKTLRDNPDIRKAYIDVTGVGAGVYDICRNNGFAERVAGINFGSKAEDPKRYVNRRAEMQARTKEWLLDAGGADIPDNDEAHRHLAASGFKYDANSRLQIESKEDIKKRLGFSPDWADALGLTFAEILPIDFPDGTPKWMRDFADDEDGGDFMTA